MKLNIISSNLIKIFAIHRIVALREGPLVLWRSKNSECSANRCWIQNSFCANQFSTPNNNDRNEMEIENTFSVYQKEVLLMSITSLVIL